MYTFQFVYSNGMSVSYKHIEEVSYSTHQSEIHVKGADILAHHFVFDTIFRLYSAKCSYTVDGHALRSIMVRQDD